MKKIITMFAMLLIACSLSASHVHLSLTGVTSGSHFYYCATTVDTVIVHKPTGSGIGDWYHSGIGTFSEDSAIITPSSAGFWYFDDGTQIQFYVNFVSIAPTQPWTSTDTTKCVESSIVLKAQTTGQPDFTYNWSTGSTASQITVSTPGSYAVTVTGACGGVADTIIVHDYPVPAPDLGPDVDTCDGNTVTLDPGVFATYHWSSTNAVTPPIDVTTAGTYSVTVTDTHGCHGKDTVIVSFILNAGEPIKLVTIDTIDGNNKITWLTNTPSNVTTKIYRNGSATLVGTANYLDGTFTDNVNSVNQTWTYRISTIDVCGNESPLSPYHTTISSAVVPIVGGGFRIEWTAYSIEGGAKTVSKYHIFSTQGLGANWIVTELAVVDSNVLQYNIPMIPDSMLVVGAEFSNGSKSVEFALSNIVNNPFTGINPIVAAHQQPISPNPSTAVFVVFGEGTVSVYDAIGNLVSQAEEIHGQKTLNLHSKGTYMVVLTDHGKVLTQKVIVR